MTEPTSKAQPPGQCPVCGARWEHGSFCVQCGTVLTDDHQAQRSSDEGESSGGGRTGSWLAGLDRRWKIALASSVVIVLALTAVLMIMSGNDTYEGEVWTKPYTKIEERMGYCFDMDPRYVEAVFQGTGQDQGESYDIFKVADVNSPGNPAVVYYYESSDRVFAPGFGYMNC
ncbi:MAG: hypothetical protein M3198_10430 [Actinomycetota bacterium]|nr:hypothetical protein [Actinomycetota bacterium]